MDFDFFDRISMAFGSKNKYQGFKFVLHRHIPVKGSPHLDLRFEDVYNKDILHSFAIPIEWLDNMNWKTTIYKMPNHTKDWLTKEKKSGFNQLHIIDKGTIDYKCYRPSGYFEIQFHGKLLDQLKRLMKIKCTYRDDVWLMNNI